MPIKGKFKYDADMIENIYQQIKICEEAGQTMEYEIRVDGQRTVPRTTKPELFYTFERFVTSNTKGLEIYFYSGDSNFHERYIFWFEGSSGSGTNNHPSEQGFSGFETESRIRDRIKKESELERLYKEIKDLEEDYEELDTDYEELKADYEKLKAELEEERSRSNDLWRPLIAELGSGVLGSVLKGKISIPAAGLAGTEEEENNSETKVNVSKAEVQDEETKKAVAFAGYLKERFQGKAYQKIMLIIDALAQNNSRIEEVWEVLTEEGGKDE